MARLKIVSPESFTHIWNTSRTMEEVMERTGYTSRGALTSRASLYRRKGVSLKSLRKPPTGNRVDWDRVKRVADAALRDGAS